MGTMVISSCKMHWMLNTQKGVCFINSCKYGCIALIYTEGQSVLNRWGGILVWRIRFHLTWQTEFVPHMYLPRELTTNHGKTGDQTWHRWPKLGLPWPRWLLPSTLPEARPHPKHIPFPILISPLRTTLWSVESAWSRLAFRSLTVTMALSQVQAAQAATSVRLACRSPSQVGSDPFCFAAAVFSDYVACLLNASSWTVFRGDRAIFPRPLQRYEDIEGWDESNEVGGMILDLSYGHSLLIFFHSLWVDWEWICLAATSFCGPHNGPRSACRVHLDGRAWGKEGSQVQWDAVEDQGSAQAQARRQHRFPWLVFWWI